MGFLARFIREACLRVQGNLETVVEFLPRPRRPGLSRMDHWLRPTPAKTNHFFAGADNPEGKFVFRSGTSAEGGFLLIEDYLRVRPYLYHLTHRRNLKHIREMGQLFSASVLMEGSGKADLIGTPRRGPEPVTFAGREIIIRDQDRLRERNMSCRRVIR